MVSRGASTAARCGSGWRHWPAMGSPCRIWVRDLQRRAAVDGTTNAYVALDGRMAGAFVMDDPVRPGDAAGGPGPPARRFHAHRHGDRRSRRGRGDRRVRGRSRRRARRSQARREGGCGPGRVRARQRPRGDGRRWYQRRTRAGGGGRGRRDGGAGVLPRHPRRPISWSLSTGSTGSPRRFDLPASAHHRAPERVRGHGPVPRRDDAGGVRVPARDRGRAAPGGHRRHRHPQRPAGPPGWCRTAHRGARLDGHQYLARRGAPASRGRHRAAPDRRRPTGDAAGGGDAARAAGAGRLPDGRAPAA